MSVTDYNRIKRTPLASLDTLHINELQAYLNQHNPHTALHILKALKHSD